MNREFDLRRHRYSLQGSSVQMKDLLDELHIVGSELFDSMATRNPTVRIGKLNHFTDLLAAVNDEHGLLLEHAAAVAEHDKLAARREDEQAEARQQEREAVGYKHQAFEMSAEDRETIKQASREGVNVGREQFLRTAEQFSMEVTE